MLIYWISTYENRLLYNRREKNIPVGNLYDICMRIALQNLVYIKLESLSSSYLIRLFRLRMHTVAVYSLRTYVCTKCVCVHTQSGVHSIVRNVTYADNKNEHIIDGWHCDCYFLSFFSFRYMYGVHRFFICACASWMYLLLLRWWCAGDCCEQPNRKMYSRCDGCVNFPRSISLNWKSFELWRERERNGRGEWKREMAAYSRPLTDLLSSIFCTLVVIEWTVINLKCFCTCDTVCRFAAHTHILRAYHFYKSIHLSAHKHAI